MIKRLAKSKKSKKGAILVIVVLILALAMIFIASAMMLTQATRRRLYSTTMQSQARLTVTAASEVFLEALKTQEITDVMIEDILKKKSTPAASDAGKIRMVVDGVPGMSETDNTNCTYVDIYKAEDYDTTKKIHIDFSTIVGNDRENIKVVLQERDVVVSYGGRFSNQIEIGGNVTSAQLRFTHGVGMVNPSYFTQLSQANNKLGTGRKSEWLYVDDNTILIRGSAKETTNDAVFYSDVVFSGGDPAMGATNIYRGRIVLLDKTYFTQLSSGPKFEGDFYFIGTNNVDAGFKATTANWPSSYDTKNYIFSNRDIQDKTKDTCADNADRIKKIVTATGAKCYLIDANGDPRSSFKATNDRGSYATDITNSASSITDEMKHYVGVYRGYKYDTEAFPTDIATQVFNKINPDGGLTPVAAGYEIKTDYAYGKGGTVYTKGTKLAEADELYTNPLTKTHPSDAKTLDLSKLADLDKYYAENDDGDNNGDTTGDGTTKTDRIIGLPSGNYLIKGSSSITDSTQLGAGPYVIAIDGSNAGRYRFWFSGNSTHKLDFVVFAVYGANNLSPSIATFVLEQGADVVLISDAKFSTQSGKSFIANSGFVSITRKASIDSNKKPTGADQNTPKLIGNYIHGHTYGYEDNKWGDTFKTKKNEVIKYSTYYEQKFDTTKMVDQSPKPAIYILGVGGNDFAVGPSARLEAYVGLYGGNGHYDSPGKADEATQIYGRIEANQIDCGYSTGSYCMPYCPAPSKSSGLPDVRPASSKYAVCDIVYYY